MRRGSAKSNAAVPWPSAAPRPREKISPFEPTKRLKSERDRVLAALFLFSS